MPRSIRTESERPCEHCKFFVRAGKRELKPFPDGRNYLVTGTCNNPRSILNTLEITGNMTAAVNAMHHRKASGAARMDCFEPAEGVFR